MDDVGLVESVLDLTGFCLGDSLGNVRSDRTGLRGRHQATGTKDTTELTDDTHHVGSGDSNVEVQEAFVLDAVCKIFGTDDLCTGFFSGLGHIALGEDGDADALTGTVRENDCTTDLLVSVTGVDTQTDVSFDSFVELGFRCIADELESFVYLISLGFVDELFAVDIFLAVFHSSLPPALVFHNDAHGTCGTCDHRAGRLDAGSIEVTHFRLGDLFDLVHGDGRDFGLVGFTGSFLDSASLLDEDSCGRGLGDECETVVCINCDDDRNDEAHVILGALIELLGERHDVDAVLTKGRTDGRCRSCFTCGDLQFNETDYLLCHCFCTSKKMW